MHIQRIHYGKLSLLLATAILLLFLLQKCLFSPGVIFEEVEVIVEEKYPTKPTEIEKVRSEKEAVAWTSLHNCPVCLGKDLCADFQQGFISVGLFPKRKWGTAYLEYTAKLQNSDELTALVPDQWLWDQWDNWICSNSSKWTGCLVSEAVKTTQLARSSGDAPFLRGLGDGREQEGAKPLTACATRKLAELLREAFDENKDGTVTQEEKAMLFTTVSTAPSIAVMRMAQPLNLNNVPRYIGGCGRVAVLEGGLTPLTSFRNADWAIRADKAKQILNVVERLLSNEWVLLAWDLDWSSFSVSRTGQVVLTDLNSVTPIDRALIGRPSEEARDVCSGDCLTRFRSSVLQSTPRGQPGRGCRDGLLYGDVMYHDICRNIFSPAGSEAGLLEGGGPELALLLAECITEKGSGERWRVVEDINIILGADEVTQTSSRAEGTTEEDEYYQDLSKHPVGNRLGEDDNNDDDEDDDADDADDDKDDDDDDGDDKNDNDDDDDDNDDDDDDTDEDNNIDNKDDDEDEDDENDDYDNDKKSHAKDNDEYESDKDDEEDE